MMSEPVEPGQIYRDARGRWLRVDAVNDTSAVLIVVAQKIGDRITTPMRTTNMITDRVAKLERVDAAPEPSGPDYQRIDIDRVNQTVRFNRDDAVMPYHVSSAGPRVRRDDEGNGGTVTVTFSVADIREWY